MSIIPLTNKTSVNEIFDPDRVDGIYNQNAAERAAAIALDRGTNYGVVRLELLEHLYEKMYMQRLQHANESQWRCRIIPNRAVLSTSQSKDSGVMLHLGIPEERRVHDETGDEEVLEVDYVFTATGYKRNAHEEMLSEVKDLLPEEDRERRRWPVGRDYRVGFEEGKVSERAGVWLQGCNEGTHGVSFPFLFPIPLF